MKRAIEINEISTLSSILLTTLDETIFFSKLSEFILLQTGVDMVRVFHAFSNGSTQLVAENGKPVVEGQVWDKGTGLSGHVTRTKRPYYSNNVSRDPIFTPNWRVENFDRELALPISSNGTIIGSIHLLSKDVEEKFGEEDINEIMNILKKLQAPLSNMRMYLMAKDLNRELLKKIEEKEGFDGKVSNRIQENHKIELIGHSSIFSNLMEKAQKIAREDFPLLIEGEVGSGKKLLAKKIHCLSNRKSNSVGMIDCQQEDASIIEAELFGNKVRRGVLESNNGGTVILSEISKLSVITQRKLLAVLTTGEFISGHSEKLVQVNIRFISTSKNGIDMMVENGEFLGELYHRLNTITLKMPSLSERRDDIKVLAEHFINLNAKDGEHKMFTAKAIERMTKYIWPGNVRELKNVIDGIRTLVEDTYIDEEHLPKKLKVELKAKQQDVKEDFSLVTLEELEKRHIVKTLEHLGCNKTRAAKALGITVKTLYNKLHSYGLVSAEVE